VATPVQPGFNPPPPPPGYPGPTPVPYGVPAPRREGTISAGWALLLAIASAVLLGLGTLIYSLHLSVLVLQKVGEKASLEQQQKAMIEVMPTVPITPATATCLFVGAFCGIAGLALGARSLVRAEGHTGKAIAACVLAGISVFCQILLTIALAGGTSAAH
jgi:drug/metabolite transporter (DMT)-like permease